MTKHPFLDYIKLSMFEEFIKDNKEIPELFTIQETGMIKTLELCNSKYNKQND